MELHTYPDPVLSSPMEEVTDFGPDLKKIVEQMWDTMHAKDGVGLAAPQVGLCMRMLVAISDGVRYVLINPHVTEQADEEETMDEGCLSFPGIYVPVTRPKWVKVRYQDEDGNEREETLEGFTARVCCHEMDHLSGKLLIDHVSPLKRAFIKKKLARLRRDEMGNSN